MMKLYYIPTTRAVRPRWLLEEMGVAYELVQANMQMLAQPEYRQLHPHGKVPVLVDGETVICESAAICAYLTDKYPEKGFAPAPETPAQGYYYQWLFYATLTLEAPVEQYMFAVLPDLPEKLLPQEKNSAGSKEKSLEWFDRVAQPMREILKDKDYLVENQFSTADVVTGGVLMWALRLGMLNSEDSLKAYVENLMQRPGFQRADEDFYAKIE